MQKTAPFEPTRARDTISTVSLQHTAEGRDRDNRGHRTDVYRCAPMHCRSAPPLTTVTHSNLQRKTGRADANGREWDANGEPRRTCHTHDAAQARNRRSGRKAAMKSSPPPANAPTTAPTACVVPAPARGGGEVVDFFWRVAAVLWQAAHGQRMGREAGSEAHTLASDVALAAQNDPPNPAAKPGPIHGMGRAAHSRVHALSGHLDTRKTSRR